MSEALPAVTLLVTTQRGLESRAGAELFGLLHDLGDTTPEIQPTGVSGLLRVTSKIPARQFLEHVRGLVSRDPWRIRYLLRLIPVDAVVDSRLESLADAVAPLVKRIGESESFRITVEKRHTTLSTPDVIGRLAKRIDRKVSLDSPGWIVLVEIVGTWAGLSVLRPQEMLSVAKEKH
jgi:tRNA acetyltransferase TAN1